MWNKLLGVNSLIISITFVFLVYTALQAVFYWAWKPFWIVVAILCIELIVQVAISTLSE